MESDENDFSYSPHKKKYIVYMKSSKLSNKFNSSFDSSKKGLRKLNNSQITTTRLGTNEYSDSKSKPSSKQCYSQMEQNKSVRVELDSTENDSSLPRKSRELINNYLESYSPVIAKKNKAKNFLIMQNDSQTNASVSGPIKFIKSRNSITKSYNTDCLKKIKIDIPNKIKFKQKIREIIAKSFKETRATESQMLTYEYKRVVQDMNLNYIPVNSLNRNLTVYS